ncbi:VWA domain-containing protein [bacterium]|nr:VWA domain-containing protein [bacterium]
MKNFIHLLILSSMVFFSTSIVAQTSSNECAHEVIFVIDVSHSICSYSNAHLEWNSVVNQLQTFIASMTGDLKVGILLMGTEEDEDKLFYIHANNAQHQINQLWSKAKNICNVRRGSSRTGLKGKIDLALDIFNTTTTSGVTQHLVIVSDGHIEDDNPEYDENPGPHWSWLNYAKLFEESDYRVYSILINPESSSEKTRSTIARRQNETGELFFWEYLNDYKKENPKLDLSEVSFDTVIEYVSTRNIPTSKNPQAYTPPILPTLKWHQNLVKYNMLEEFEAIRESVIELSPLWELHKHRNNDNTIFDFLQEVSREFQDKGYFHIINLFFHDYGRKAYGHEELEQQLKTKFMALAQKNNSLRKNLAKAMIDDPDNAYKFTRLDPRGYLKAFASYRTDLRQRKLMYDFKKSTHARAFEQDLNTQLNCIIIKP